MATNPYIDRIMDRIRIRVPGALDGVVQIELYDVLNEFCSDTNVWQQDIELTLKPGKEEYDVSAGGGGEIWRIIRTRNPDGTVFQTPLWMEANGTFRIARDVSVKTEVVVTIAMAPGLLGKKQAYPDVPDFIWNDYYDVILDGVVGRLYAQPAKPYSNPQMALFHTKKFQAGIARTKHTLESGRLYGGQNWRFPQSFNRRMLRRS